MIKYHRWLNSEQQRRSLHMPTGKETQDYGPADWRLVKGHFMLQRLYLFYFLKLLKLVLSRLPLFSLPMLILLLSSHQSHLFALFCDPFDLTRAISVTTGLGALIGVHTEGNHSNFP